MPWNRQAEVHPVTALVELTFHLRELDAGRVEAGLQAFGLAKPALFMSFDDPVAQVDDDLLETADLGVLARLGAGTPSACPHSSARSPRSGAP